MRPSRTGTPALFEKLICQKGHLENPTLQIAARIPKGGRNDALFKLACSLRGKGLNVEEIMPSLQAVNTHRCDPALSESEIQTIANSTSRYGPGNILQSFLRVFDELNPTEDCEHLMEWARENPKDYYSICSKLFPTRTELSGPDGKPIERRDVRE